MQQVGIKVLDNVRSKECFVIQSTAPPVNDNLVELCLIADALKRAACKVGIFAYKRQLETPSLSSCCSLPLSHCCFLPLSLSLLPSSSLSLSICMYVPCFVCMRVRHVTAHACLCP